jgi:sulfofructose kinase
MTRLPSTPLPMACVGHSAVDHHFEVEAFPAHPTKTPAHRYRQIVGGMAANAALALARLGAPVRLLGRVGDDEAGQFVRGELQHHGVLTLLETVAGTRTSVSSVVVDAHGERQIFNHRGDALARAHALDVKQLEGVGAVLVDPRWCEGAATALQWARAQGVLSMLDADVAPAQDLLRLLPMADWVVFSEPGLAVLAPGQSVDAALAVARAAGARNAMVTQGAAGVHWWQAGQSHHHAAFEVQALDTTGAGDVFHAALLWALAHADPAAATGPDTSRAVRFACAAAALKCQRHDGALGAPRLAEVEAFLEGLRLNR